MGSLRWSVLTVAAPLVLWVGAEGGVRAEPLPKDACDALLTEEQTLEKAGARSNLDKGADWGRANLDKTKLSQVQRLIKVTEDLVFRCGLAGQRFAAFVEPEPPPPPPVKKPAPKPKPKPDAKVSPKPQASNPQPKPKSKADDAYRPPAKAVPAEQPKG